MNQIRKRILIAFSPFVIFELNGAAIDDLVFYWGILLPALLEFLYSGKKCCPSHPREIKAHKVF